MVAKMTNNKINKLVIIAALFLAACNNPEKAWELAEREDTNQGYLEFLAKYPDGDLADKARTRMKELKLERAWERAQFRDRVANYQRFLEEYPTSPYAAAATARIYELNRDAAWEAATDAETIPALENFLAVYPDAPQADEAQQLIAALTPPEPEPPPVPLERDGNFRLQIGAFRTAAAAETEVRRLAGIYEDRLYGPIKILTPAEHDGRWFLLRTVPLNRVEATDLCDYLQQAGQSCMMVNR